MIRSSKIAFFIARESNPVNYRVFPDRRTLTAAEKRVCTRVWSIRFDRGEDWAIRKLDAISWDVDLSQAKLDAQASSQGQERVRRVAREFGRKDKEIWDLLEQNDWSFDAVRDALHAASKNGQGGNKATHDKVPESPLIDSSALKMMKIASWVPARILMLKSKRRLTDL